VRAKKKEAKEKKREHVILTINLSCESRTTA
jgi:hypothetical protein